MTLTMAQHRAALAEAASAETAAVRAYLAATGPAAIGAQAALDQAQARYRDTRAAFDAAYLADDARRRAVRSARALAAAVRAELTGPQLEAFEIQAADAWARYVTLTAPA